MTIGRRFGLRAACIIAVMFMVALQVIADERAAATWEALDGAWNARDHARFTELFTDDATLKFVERQLVLDGRGAIHSHFERQFPATPDAYSHHTEIRRYAELPGGALSAEGRVEVRRDADLFRAFDVVAVMVPDRDGWRIRLLYAYLLEPR